MANKSKPKIDDYTEYLKVIRKTLKKLYKTLRKSRHVGNMELKSMRLCIVLLKEQIKSRPYKTLEKYLDKKYGILDTRFLDDGSVRFVRVKDGVETIDSDRKYRELEDRFQKRHSLIWKIHDKYVNTWWV